MPEIFALFLAGLSLFFFGVSGALPILAESLNPLLLTMLDALQSGVPDDLELLLGMTADRGDLMERLRRNLLHGAPALDHQKKALLFYLTSLFERAVWLFRQAGLAQRSLDGSAAIGAQ